MLLYVTAYKRSLLLLLLLMLLLRLKVRIVWETVISPVEIKIEIKCDTGSRKISLENVLAKTSIWYQTEITGFLYDVIHVWQLYMNQLWLCFNTCMIILYYTNKKCNIKLSCCYY